MLLDLLGLAVEKVCYPLSGSWWDGTDTSLDSIVLRAQIYPVGELFCSGWGIHGLHKSPREVRCRMWWLSSVCAVALADQAQEGLCFMAWAEVGLGPGPSDSLANAAVIKF